MSETIAGVDAFEIRMRLFGGTTLITLYDIEHDVAEVIESDIRDEALRLQGIFNLYDPKSELSRLNRERSIVPSVELREVMAEAIRFSRLSEGAFDVSKGKLFLAVKGGEPLPEISCTFEDIDIGVDQITLLSDDVIVDLGSIAKGYCADRLAGFIVGLGVKGFSIDARGDVIVRDELGESIEIKDPRREGNVVGSFVLKDGAVATSGDYRQFVGSFDNSHILGAHDLASVSVRADTLMEADALATVLFSMGLDSEFLAKRLGVSAYVITTDGNHKHFNWM